MVRETAEERGHGRPKTHQRRKKRLPSTFEHAEKESRRRRPTSSEKSTQLQALTAPQAPAKEIEAAVQPTVEEEASQ